MLKGAVFTLGLLATVGGIGFGAFTVFAAGMSDAPQSGIPPEATASAAVAVTGVLMMIAAWSFM